MANLDFKKLNDDYLAAKELYDAIQFLLADGPHQERRVESELQKIYGMKALTALENISVEELKNSKAGIRVSLLKDAGYENLYQLARLKDWELTAIDGIGEKQAEAIRNIITEFINSMAKHVHVKLTLEKDENGEVPNMELLMALTKMRLGDGQRILANTLGDKVQGGLWNMLSRIKVRSMARRIFSTAKTRRESKQAGEELEQFMASHVYHEGTQIVEDYYYAEQKLTALDSLRDFERNAAAYYALLEKFAGSAKANPLIYSSIPAQLAATIDESPLELREFKGTLRSYQAFGAKYILFERKVLLGDEMGLGKTVQAIAAMCDIYALDPQSLFLVICPASVLINWCREVKKFSNMEAYLIHGPLLESSFEDWKNKGGVAVTNFETMEKIVRWIDKKLKLAMLVIDEAHYIKNPDAQRTQNIRRLEDESERILMMTGTPLENRVDEMCQLIEFLRPDMVEEVRKHAFMSNVPEFRELLAPVYLRRQRDQVLEELPPIEEKQEWCEMTTVDREAYRSAVADRDFNDMRRVSFMGSDVGASAKVTRLLEICRDAMEDGRKIVIFSFFRETIDKVQALLGEQCVGSITGSTEVSQRQIVIDRLSNAKPGSALVCQIQAGGTGLNIQAASVVIFCEPQIKPSLTNQAISRVYRMGQVRNVLVYHLLCENTVDESMVQMLERKQKEFDAYADESAIADALDQLVDKDWIQSLIEAENRKYLSDEEIAKQ